MTATSDRWTQMHNLNPFGVAEGAESYSILIDCNTSTHGGQRLDWVGRVVIPAEVNGEELELEDAATLAFQMAQQMGLPAQLMAICAFYFWNEGWVQFL